MWDSTGADRYPRKDIVDQQDHCFNKENLSPEKMEECSLYETTTSVSRCDSQRIDDLDISSQDSGFETGFQGETSKFFNYTSPSTGISSSFGSGSIGSLEEDFMEDFSDLEPLEKKALPNDFSKLISEPLAIKSNSKEKSPNDTIMRPLFRRALSLQNPVSSNVRTSLFGPRYGDIEVESKMTASIKRPDPPTSTEKPTKRSKLFNFSSPQVPKPPVPVFKRQFSATEESIMCAVQRSSTEPDLIGDFSKSYCLPLTSGRHQDLKAITPETLAKLMRGEFSDSVASFKVIDCRYPYEFVGGHIDGAINIYTKEEVGDLLLETRNPSTGNNKRHILIFHCEFSSERGPNLYRYLRKEDRARNISDYPLLHYPEIYLLEGGYKNFFQQFAKMCVPVAYKEMLHPDHEDDLRHFRQKSKTWNTDFKLRPRGLRRL